MREVSQEYKQLMSGLIQPPTQIKVDINIYNVEASDTARSSPSSSLYWSNITGINAGDTSSRYVTFEPGFYRLDRDFLIEPEDEEAYVEQGWTTELMCGEDGEFATTILLEISFPKPQYGFLGFTFHFDVEDDCYPEKVLFEAYNNEHFIVAEEVEITSANMLVTPEFVDGFNLLFLHFSAMHKPFRRLRVDKIGFGATQTFLTEDILSTEHQEEVNPISATLPKSSLSFEIINMDKRYNADNPDGLWEYLEEEQPVTLYHGVNVDGATEWVKATSLLNTGSPTISATSAKFSAQSPIALLNDTYYKGDMLQTNLYQMAESVLTDAYAEKYNRPKQWKLDDALKNRTTFAPLPKLPHNQCLQLIATAGRCVLRSDVDGAIELKTQLNPTVKISAEQPIYYSSLSGLTTMTNGMNPRHYITFEPYGWRLSGQGNIILPDAGEYEETGFVSELISDETGLFSVLPAVSLQYSHQYTNYEFELLFDVNNQIFPTAFNVEYYNGEKQVDILEVRNNDSAWYTVSHYVSGFDRVEIKAIRMNQPFSRFSLARIGEGYVNDYLLDFSQAIVEPPVTKEARVKNVEVIYHSYLAEQSETEIAKKTITVKDRETVTIEYAPATQLSLAVTKGNVHLSGIEMWAQECHFMVEFIGEEPPETEEIEITVSGYKIIDEAQSVLIPVERDGETCTFDNPLITDSRWAREVGEWIADYLKGRNVYDFDVRQDYRLEANDIVYLDTAFSKKQIARVVSVKNTAPGQIGHVRLRRLE